MSREAHVQFCEGLAGKFRWSTLLVVCFQSGKEAEEFSKALKERLGRYGLKTSENKSKIIEFGRYAWQKAKEQGKGLGAFDFLGFTHYCDKSRKGKFKLGRKTSRKKFIQKVKAMNVWAKEREESDTIKTMVEGIKDEVDRTLPLLWDKREYANNEAVL